MKKVTLLILALLVVAGTAKAAVIYSQDFEAEAIGSAAGFVDDLPPTETDVPGVVDLGGNKVLRFVDDNTDPGQILMRRFFDGGPVTAMDFTYSLKIASTRTIHDGHYIIAGMTPNTSMRQFKYAAPSLDGFSSLNYISSGDDAVVVATFQPGDLGDAPGAISPWAEIYITCYWDNVVGKYMTQDITIVQASGTTSVVGTAQKSASAIVDHLYFQMGAKNSSYYVGTEAYLDDILVETIPEPATMLLLGLGGLLLRRKS